MILCYHAISAEWNHALAVMPQAFEQQVRSLRTRRYRFVGADEAVRGRGRILHITFDDAFRSVSNAVPTLERLGIPFTVFACSGYAADGRPLAVPRLAAEAAKHPEHLETMTWDELRALAERGVEIGSHTISHPSLPSLSDAELERELRESREAIESELARPCRYLAYPFGDHDERTRAATRRAGYEAAYALQGGADAADPYALPRTDLYRRDHLLRATLKTSFLKPAGTGLLQFFQRASLATIPL